MRYKYILTLLLLGVLFILGCGNSNVLQGLTKPGEHEDNLALAQQYLDEGRYSKAEKLARDLLVDNTYSNDEEATVILGQALMGLAGVDLEGVISHINTDQETPSSNITKLNIVPLSKRDYLFEAVDILLNIDTDYQPVRFSAGIAGICASVAKINSTFDPLGGTIGDGQGGEPSPSTTINVQWQSIYPTISDWTNRGLAALYEVTNDENLRNAASSINVTLLAAEAQMGAPVTYATLLSILAF